MSENFVTFSCFVERDKIEKNGFVFGRPSTTLQSRGDKIQNTIGKRKSVIKYYYLEKQSKIKELYVVWVRVKAPRNHLIDLEIEFMKRPVRRYDSALCFRLVKWCGLTHLFCYSIWCWYIE
jgi:hypothetical protein